MYVSASRPRKGNSKARQDLRASAAALSSTLRRFTWCFPRPAMNGPQLPARSGTEEDARGFCRGRGSGCRLLLSRGLHDRGLVVDRGALGLPLADDGLHIGEGGTLLLPCLLDRGDVLGRRPRRLRAVPLLQLPFLSTFEKPCNHLELLAGIPCCAVLWLRALLPRCELLPLRAVRRVRRRLSRRILHHRKEGSNAASARSRSTARRSTNLFDVASSSNAVPSARPEPRRA